MILYIDGEPVRHLEARVTIGDIVFSVEAHEDYLILTSTSTTSNEAEMGLRRANEIRSREADSAHIKSMMNDLLTSIEASSAPVEGICEEITQLAAVRRKHALEIERLRSIVPSFTVTTTTKTRRLNRGKKYLVNKSVVEWMDVPVAPEEETKSVDTMMNGSNQRFLLVGHDMMIYSNGVVSPAGICVPDMKHAFPMYACEGDGDDAFVSHGDRIYLLDTKLMTWKTFSHALDHHHYSSLAYHGGCLFTADDRSLLEYRENVWNRLVNIPDNAPGNDYFDTRVVEVENVIYMICTSDDAIDIWRYDDMKLSKIGSMECTETGSIRVHESCIYIGGYPVRKYDVRTGESEDLGTPCDDGDCEEMFIDHGVLHSIGEDGIWRYLGNKQWMRVCDGRANVYGVLRI